MLECVVNVSEGRDGDVLADLAASCGSALLDVHSDAHHNRSVFTLVGEDAPRALTARCVEVLRIGSHEGVHPRLGVVDVVPFVPLEGSTMDDAVRARDSYARWAATTLGVPVFLYGPERTLPRVRRDAWGALLPDLGPSRPHPTAGAVCAGARDVLVAYNVWLDTPDPVPAKRIAAAVRSEDVRALGLVTGGVTQVSMNLVNVEATPIHRVLALVRDEAARHGAAISGCEVVGLIPEAAMLASAPLPDPDTLAGGLSILRHFDWRPLAPKIPQPVLIIHGAADPLMPLDGGDVKSPWGNWTNRPVVEQLTKWAEAIGCEKEPKVISDKDDVKKVEYPSNSNGPTLTVLYLEGHGHHWPGAKQTLPESMIGPI